MKRSLREVVFYVWRWGSEEQPEFLRVPALEYWIGDLKEGKKSWIIVGERFREWRSPDAEILSCGHEQVIRVWNRFQIFNRRRVCKVCAMDCFIASHSVEA